LKVIAIGNITSTGLEGFKLKEDGTCVSTITSATWHNMMIVKGVDPHTVLLRVKRMREDDNIHAYFNSDNAAKVSDCLRLPNGTFVHFNSDNFELYAQPNTGKCLPLRQTAFTHSLACTCCSVSCGSRQGPSQPHHSRWGTGQTHAEF